MYHFPNLGQHLLQRWFTYCNLSTSLLYNMLNTVSMDDFCWKKKLFFPHGFEVWQCKNVKIWLRWFWIQIRLVGKSVHLTKILIYHLYNSPHFLLRSVWRWNLNIHIRRTSMVISVPLLKALHLSSSINTKLLATLYILVHMISVCQISWDLITG